MSVEKNQQFLVPKGFAHSFIVLSESAEILYKTDDFHYPELEGGILFSDPDLNIDWKMSGDQITVSERDKKHPRLKDANFNF